MLTIEDARDFSETLAEAAARVCKDYAEGDVIYEEPFTDQLCARLKESLVGLHTDHVRWQAEGDFRGRLKARSLSKYSEEPHWGADAVFALDIDTPGYAVKKAFLAQAKRLEPGKFLETDRYLKLIDQCQKMIALTPASMVFLYHNEGVHVVPATAVLASRTQDLWSLATYDFQVLFQDFAMCWFGDPRFRATDMASLAGLKESLGARTALLIRGSSGSDFGAM